MKPFGKDRNDVNSVVALRAGAWIETLSLRAGMSVQRMSPSVRGRGLKRDPASPIRARR